MSIGSGMLARDWSTASPAMLVYLTPLDDRVIVSVRPAGQGVVGDVAHEVRVVRPGEAFAGLDYDALQQMGEGEHELPDQG